MERDCWNSNGTSDNRSVWDLLDARVASLFAFP